MKNKELFFSCNRFFALALNSLTPRFVILRMGLNKFRLRPSFAPSFAKSFGGHGKATKDRQGLLGHVRTSAVFKAKYSQSIKTNRSWIVLVFSMFFLALQMNLIASQAPYIPSYDDRYEQDLKQANANKDYFKEPEDALNYAQYRYVGANAAEKYPRFVTEYTRQEQTILGMLTTGVRGLTLSTYNWSLSWSSIIRDGVSVVCSNPTKETTVFRKNGKPLYQSLHYEMNRIFNFLKSHPRAVITVFLQDYADISKITRDLQEIVSKNKYDPICKPADWSAAQQNGEWPTLGWMRNNNKRLVLFTQTYGEHTDYTWPVNQYFWENNYGSIEANVMCSEDKESAKELKKRNRTLVSFGCYGGAAIGSGARNSNFCFEYNSAKQLVTSCQTRRFARGKLFNVYWADHVIRATKELAATKRKTVFDYVNEINAALKK